MRFPSTFAILAIGAIWTTLPAQAADRLELTQTFYTGGKPGYFKMKIDGTSGWADTIKNSKGGRQVRQSFRLNPHQVEEVFARVGQMGVWSVEPVSFEKPRKGEFFHTGEIEIKAGDKKREIAYRIDREYMVDDTRAVGKGIEPRTQLGKIDRYLSEVAGPLRQPANKTPE